MRAKTGRGISGYAVFRGSIANRVACREFEYWRMFEHDI